MMPGMGRPRAMGQTFYRRSGGKAAISREIAAYHMKNIRVHDDGISGFGGVSLMMIGPMGCGKTTLLEQLAASVAYVPAPEQLDPSRIGEPLISKDEYRGPVMPETVIMRGRKYDYWNSLIAYNWRKSYPQSPIARIVCVHTHVKDALQFIEQRRIPVPLVFDGKYLQHQTYTDAADLYTKLIPGAINVVYEPSEYFLQPAIVKAITKKSLSDLRAARLKRSNKPLGKKTAEKIDATPVEAPSGAFWFELIERLMELNRERQFYSIFIDEAHQVAGTTDSAGELWHLMGWLAMSVIDMRRNNISLFLTTHDAQLVDYRVVDRILYFAWMPGSKVYPRLSMLNKTTPALLDKGEFLIEESGLSFGFSTYDPIPEQPPLIYAEGISTGT